MIYELRKLAYIICSIGPIGVSNIYDRSIGFYARLTIVEILYVQNSTPGRMYARFFCPNGNPADTPVGLPRQTGLAL